MRREHPEWLVTGGVGVLFAAVIALTVAIIAMFGMTTYDSAVPFDMDRLTDLSGTEEVDITPYLTPEFIGISAAGEKKGISAGINIVRELYAVLAPVLSDVLAEAYTPAAFLNWQTAAEEGSYIYVRYHDPLPLEVIRTFAGGSASQETSGLSVVELMILPDKGFCTFVRSPDGAVYVFDGTYETYFTVDDLTELMRSYRRSFFNFSFIVEDERMEAVFTERVRTKNMLVTEKTAALIQNQDEDIEKLLRLLDFNPDKLYTHEESDVGFVYVETHGVMRLLDDSVEYVAAYGGGISLSELLRLYDREQYTLSDYLAASCRILESVKGMDSYYLGGDADITLSSAVGGEDGSLVFTFVYTFDNLPLVGCEPALKITFREGKVESLRLYSVAARNLGEQQDSYLETWYYELASSACPQGESIADIHLVYQTDFTSESIHAAWSVVYQAKH